MEANSLRKRILLLTVLFVTTGQLALTLYLPALPAIRHSFDVTVGFSQESMTLFLAALGLSQLFYGFLSDRYGRKICLLIGLGIMTLASLYLVLAINSFSNFLMARFFQGLGAGSAAVLARAVIRDTFDQEQLASAFSILLMSASLTPALAPFVGGWIQHIFGWHAVFIFLFGYIVIILVLILFFLPETLSTSTPRLLHFSIIQTMKQLFRHEFYFFCVGLIILFYSCQVLYLTIAPFIFEGQFHLTPGLYGTIIVIPALGYLIGNAITYRLSHFFESTGIILWGISVISVAAVSIFVMGELHFLSVSLLIVLLFVLTIGLGLAYSHITALALKQFPDQAGAAASVSGFCQMVGAAIISQIMNFFHAETTSMLGLSLIICAVLMLLLHAKVQAGAQLI